MLELRGAEAKLRRAHTHAQEFHAGIQLYVEGDGMSLVPYEDSEVMRCGWLLVTREPPPEDLILIAADLMNALRSALNYCVWQAYLAAGGRPDEKGSARVQFPFVTDAANWDRVAGDMLRKVTGPALSVVRAAQPFARALGERDPLVDLAALSNEDKHRQPQICAIASISAEGTLPVVPPGLMAGLAVTDERLGIEPGVQLVSWVQIGPTPGEAAARRPDVQMQLPPPPTVELGLVGEGRQVPIGRLTQLVADVERIVAEFHRL